MQNMMEIWSQVHKTDPVHVKHVNQRGGFSAISPQYQLQSATEVFGPYGMGFGFESCDLDMSYFEPLGLVMVKAVFFYVWEDKRYTFPINNAWQVKQGQRIDPDFAKKAETNTMSKALSKLGFGADVFMGQFDDSEYVSMVGNEFALEKADDKAEEERKQAEEYQEKCKKELEMVDKAVNRNALKGLYIEYTRRAQSRQDQAQLKRLEEAKDKRLAELQEAN